MTIQPGRPFWSAFTAFAANMTALVGVDKLRVTATDIQVSNWWVAILVSSFVAFAVYGKEKVSEFRDEQGSTAPRPQPPL